MYTKARHCPPLTGEMAGSGAVTDSIQKLLVHCGNTLTSAAHLHFEPHWLPCRSKDVDAQAGAAAAAWHLRLQDVPAAAAGRVCVVSTAMAGVC